MVHTTKKGSKGIRLTAKEADARSAENAARAKRLGKKIITRPTQVLKKPIKIEKKKKGLAKLVEKKTLAGRAAKIITSPKTTGVLATTLAAVSGIGALTAGAARTGTAVVTRTAFRGTRSKFIQRAFPGKKTTQTVEKLFRANPRTAQTAARFGNTAKSTGLTKSLLSKAGLSLGAASLAVTAIGSYPFAGFIKEEAIQTLGFAFNTAERNRDIEGMEKSIAEIEEILNNAETIMDKVPFANIVKQLGTFFRAAEVKLEVDRARLETLRGEVEAGETAFQTSQAEGRQTQLEQRERDSEYFRLIREGKFDEAEELLQSELKGGT